MMYNIDIKEAIAYKHHNMELKDNDVIGQFRQNILGESALNSYYKETYKL